MIDVAKYKSMGFKDEEIQQAVMELDSENKLNESYNRAVGNQTMQRSNTLVAGMQHQDDLIRWQLELDSILERVEHILKGDTPQMVNGNLIFVKAEVDGEQVFNSNGVAEIMRLLTMYLNRNTILSNYDEETINNKVFDFGVELSDLIFLKYEQMGMDTLEKRKRYPIICREIVDAVHSGYLRALNGGERESLRTARSVNQSIPLQQGGFGMPMQMGMKERSFFNPMRYIKGKFA